MARKQVAYRSCSEQCYVAKLIFVKQSSTIFGVRELWCTEKPFCESGLKCTLWNLNCQNPWLFTHTLKINVPGFANFIDEWSQCDFCLTNFGVILEYLDSSITTKKAIFSFPVRGPGMHTLLWGIHEVALASADLENSNPWWRSSSKLRS